MVKMNSLPVVNFVVSHPKIVLIAVVLIIALVDPSSAKLIMSDD